MCAQERAGRVTTVAELQKLVAALQAERGLLQAQAAQHRAAAQRTDAARREAADAAAALKVRVSLPILAVCTPHRLHTTMHPPPTILLTRHTRRRTLALVRRNHPAHME